MSIVTLNTLQPQYNIDARSQVSKATSIKVIDNHFKSINNLDEIERLRYMNDYKSLKD